ncbi:MAG: hypothetical protein ABSA30_12450, partial [Candidatus Aminicenantales bacterium]
MAPAVGTDQGRYFVSVVGDQGVVQRRSVTIGQQEEEGLVVVQQGLTADDWVVTSGRQGLRPGMIVKTRKAWNLPPSSSWSPPVPSAHPVVLPGQSMQPVYPPPYDPRLPGTVQLGNGQLILPASSWPCPCPVPPPVVTPPTSAVPAVPDEKAIQGTWEVVSSTLSLVQQLPYKDVSPEEVRRNMRIVITAGTFKVAGKYVKIQDFDYKINPDSRPRKIDLQWSPEPRQPGMRTDAGVSRGIYKFEDGCLKICAGAERPSEFWVGLGSDTELLVLRRVGDATRSDDEKAILGKWRVESVSEPESFSGAAVMGIGRTSEFTFTPDSVTPLFDGGGMSRPYRYALDPTARPKRIDTYIEASVVPAAYDLAGDRLTMCWRKAKGGTGDFLPPAKLAAGPDTVLAVLKRVRGAAEKNSSPDAAPTKPEAGNLEKWMNKAPGRPDSSQRSTGGKPQSKPAVNPAAEMKALQVQWKVVRVEKGKDADEKAIEGNWSVLSRVDDGKPVSRE